MKNTFDAPPEIYIPSKETEKVFKDPIDITISFFKEYHDEVMLSSESFAPAWAQKFNHWVCIKVVKMDPVTISKIVSTDHLYICIMGTKMKHEQSGTYQYFDFYTSQRKTCDISLKNFLISTLDLSDHCNAGVSCNIAFHLLGYNGGEI